MKKVFFTVLIVIVSLFVAVSCSNKKSAEVKQDTPVEVVKTEQVKASEQPVAAKTEPVVTPVPVNETVVIKEAQPETPVVETVVEKVVEKVVEPVVEKVVEPVVEKAKEVFKPVVYDFNYGKMKAKGVFDEASAVITFGEGVTAEELKFVLNEILASHAELKNTKLVYEIVENPLSIRMSYPKGSTIEDLNYIINTVSSGLDQAVAAYVAKITPVVEKAAEKVVETAVEPVVETVVEPVVEPVAEVVAEPVVEPVAEVVVEPAPVIVPVAEPVEVPAVAEKTVAEKAATHSFKLVLNPVDIMPDYEACDYAFGAELIYEFRFRDMAAVTASLVYNLYLDKEAKGFIVSDHAFFVDALGYGKFSDRVLFYSGLGVGINMLRVDNTVEFDPALRILAGVEVQLSEHFALNAGSAVQITFNKEGSSTATIQPARIGVVLSI